MCQEGFNRRFRTLFEEAGSPPVQQFADRIGISRQSCANYKDSNEPICPDGNTLIKIANEFGVSVDWLLGLTDIRSQSADIQNAINALGISEKAAQKIPQFPKSFSELIEDELFNKFMLDYDMFLSILQLVKSDPGKPFDIDQMEEDGRFLVHPYHASSIMIDRISKDMRLLCAEKQSQKLFELHPGFVDVNPFEL